MEDRADLKSVAHGRERSTRSSRTILKYAAVFVLGEIVGTVLTILAIITMIFRLHGLH